VVAADLDDIAARLDRVAPGLDVGVVGHGVWPLPMSSKPTRLRK
jgi:hypothetical protein